MCILRVSRNVYILYVKKNSLFLNKKKCILKQSKSYWFHVRNFSLINNGSTYFTNKTKKILKVYNINIPETYGHPLFMLFMYLSSCVLNQSTISNNTRSLLNLQKKYFKIVYLLKKILQGFNYMQTPTCTFLRFCLIKYKHE